MDVAARRVFRLASGMALAVAIGYGLNLPMPFMASIMTLFLVAGSGGPIGLKAGIGLILVIFLTLSSGLLLAPVMMNYALAGIMIVALGLYRCFYRGLTGGNSLVGLFMVTGLTMITVAGTASFALALMVIEALAKGTLVAVIISWLVYFLFPENTAQCPSKGDAPSELPDEQARWIAARSLLVVMPVFMVALYDPSKYMPIILKSVSLSQQISTIDARNAGRELLGSTLLGGIFALIFWNLLGMFPVLWMFFLWMLLFGLFIAGKLYRVFLTRYPSSFWLNVGVTVLILLGQTVQDSDNGKDAMTAFAVRMGLFVAVTLYAWGAVYAIDRWGKRNKITRNQALAL
jgi:hypothetical protein